MSFRFPVVPGQRGLATARQLAAAGASDSALRHLTRTGHRVARNVYAAAGGPLPEASRLVAGSLWAGERAVLTGVHALVVHGVDPGRTPALVRFLVPDTCRTRRSAMGFVTVRTKRMPSSQVRGLVRLAPIERALVDAGLLRELTERELQACTLAILQERRSLPDRIAHEIARTRLASGGGVIEGVLAYRLGAWSPPEALLTDAVRGCSTLPVMLANPELATGDGRHIGHPDGYFPDAGVAVQVHSRAFHDGLDARGRDRLADTFEMDLVYQRHGLVVVPVSPRTLRNDMPGFLAALAAVVLPRMGQAPTDVVVV